MLSPAHIRQAAWLVGEEISRRNIAAIPVPRALRDLHRALLDELSVQNLRRQWQQELSASGQQPGQIYSAPGELESTADVAQRLGCSERTVRRHAAANGAHRIGGRYLFDRSNET